MVVGLTVTSQGVSSACTRDDRVRIFAVSPRTVASEHSKLSGVSPAEDPRCKIKDFPCSPNLEDTNFCTGEEERGRPGVRRA